MMRSSRSAIWLALFLFLGFHPLSAQSGGGQNSQSGSNLGGTMTPPLQIAVTGCLKREADGGYYIADKNGTTWKLTPNGVNLSEHVNHSVRITGKPDTNAGQPGANQHGAKTASAENLQPGLRVLTVKVLSPICAQ
jgi:hypothetical protein